MRLSKQDRKLLEENEAAARAMEQYKAIVEVRMARFDSLTPEERAQDREENFY